MASVRREVFLNAAPETVWDAVRDFGAPHRRLTPGVLVDARLDQDGSRIVMFANGIVAREILIDADEEARRVAYTVTGTFDHHSSSMQVVDSGVGAKLIWITDVLPNERAAMVSALKDHGIAAMKRVLERAVAA